MKRRQSVHLKADFKETKLRETSERILIAKVKKLTVVIKLKVSKQLTNILLVKYRRQKRSTDSILKLTNFLFSWPVFYVLEYGKMLKIIVISFPATGFPSQKGRHRLHHHPNWAEAVCEQVPLVPYVFYPDKPVHVQVSVNHVNFSDPSYVHEAVVAWVEDLRENNFTVCVTKAGRNEKKNGKTFAMVDWLAYQGAPDGGVSGEMDMPTWWTGTSCRTVSLPPVRWLLLAIMFFLSTVYCRLFLDHSESHC